MGWPITPRPRKAMSRAGTGSWVFMAARAGGRSPPFYDSLFVKLLWAGKPLIGRGLGQSPSKTAKRAKPRGSVVASRAGGRGVFAGSVDGRRQTARRAVKAPAGGRRRYGFHGEVVCDRSGAATTFYPHGDVAPMPCAACVDAGDRVGSNPIYKKRCGRGPTQGGRGLLDHDRMAQNSLEPGWRQAACAEVLSTAPSGTTPSFR